MPCARFAHVLCMPRAGWQWAVSAGTYRLGAIPDLEALVDAMDAKLDTLDRDALRRGQGPHRPALRQNQGQEDGQLVIIKLGAVHAGRGRQGR